MLHTKITLSLFRHSTKSVCLTLPSHINDVQVVSRLIITSFSVSCPLSLSMSFPTSQSELVDSSTAEEVGKIFNTLVATFVAREQCNALWCLDSHRPSKFRCLFYQCELITLHIGAVPWPQCWVSVFHRHPPHR